MPLSVLATKRNTSCCGLTEVHGLFVSGNVLSRGETITDVTRPDGMAYFATTIRGMSRQTTALKRAGFRSVGSWRNGNTGRIVTMWVKNVTPPKTLKKPQKARRNVGRK